MKTYTPFDLVRFANNGYKVIRLGNFALVRKYSTHCITSFWKKCLSPYVLVRIEPHLYSVISYEHETLKDDYFLEFTSTSCQEAKGWMQETFLDWEEDEWVKIGYNHYVSKKNGNHIKLI